MYWDGEKEVTKQRVREIYDKELKRQGVLEMWTTNPDDFECRESQDYVIIVTDKSFNDEVLEACYENEDFSCYLSLWVVKDISRSKRIFDSLTCVYRDGQWLEIL